MSKYNLTNLKAFRADCIGFKEEKTILPFLNSKNQLICAECGAWPRFGSWETFLTKYVIVCINNHSTSLKLENGYKFFIPNYNGRDGHNYSQEWTGAGWMNLNDHSY